MGIDISQLELPKVSPAGVKLLQMLSGDDAELKVDLKQVARTIEADPTLASSIIKYANSPVYHRKSNVNNLQTALGTLGLKNIRSAVVSAIMRSQQQKNNRADELIWNHSQNISYLCRHIAKRAAPALADDLQFVGLIHDIGMLMLNHHDPHKYQSILQLARQDTLDVLESREFGITHDVVSVRICQHFRFVEQVGMVIGGYHAAQIDDKMNTVNTDVDRMVCILSLAHHIEEQIEKQSEKQTENGLDQAGFTETMPFSPGQAMRVLHLNESILDDIQQAYCQRESDEAGHEHRSE